jgi:glycosyltransferase involved in cell wall biosynthesis
MKKYDSAEIKDFVSKPLFDEKIILNKDLSWPRISIVTPSFNQGRFLERTILSVLNQKYPNLEYIVIDGGSTDRSVEVIKKYENYLAYWISEKDNGQSDAIKKGFQKSTGEILAWLNSDDIYLSDTLSGVAVLLRDGKGAEVVYGNRYIIDEKDRLISERRLTPYTSSMARLGSLYGGFGIYQPASFWRREIHERVEGVDISLRFCMDNDLFIKFALSNCRFKFLREYLVAFRVHSDSKTSTIRDVAKEEFTMILKRYNLKHDYLQGKIVSNFIRLIKILLYIFQGDSRYLYFKLFKDKVKWVS